MLTLEIGTFLSWLGIFLTIYIGWKSIAGAFNVQYKMEVLEQQLEKAYLPIFRIMEPFLYKEIDEVSNKELREALEKVQRITEKQYKYIRSSIIDFNEKLLKNIDDPNKKDNVNEWLFQYSWHIDYEFEKTRKKLYLPTRSIGYKISKKQFKNKLLLWWSISRHLILEIGVAAILAVIMTFLYFTFFR